MFLCKKAMQKKEKKKKTQCGKDTPQHPTDLFENGRLILEISAKMLMLLFHHCSQGKLAALMGSEITSSHRTDPATRPFQTKCPHDSAR